MDDIRYIDQTDGHDSNNLKQAGYTFPLNVVEVIVKPFRQKVYLKIKYLFKYTVVYFLPGPDAEFWLEGTV